MGLSACPVKDSKAKVVVEGVAVKKAVGDRTISTLPGGPGADLAVATKAHSSLLPEAGSNLRINASDTAAAKSGVSSVVADDPQAAVMADAVAASSLDDELEAFLGAGVLAELPFPAPDPPEEVARRAFAERLAARTTISHEELPWLLQEIRDVAPGWGAVPRMRCAALLLVYVARSSRDCRASFVAKGMPLLGEVLQEAMTRLEGREAAERQDAGMQVLACLTCLWALPLGRATLWEHRFSVGKAFDRLHRWCGQAGTALAAELRLPTAALCRRWKRQPRPALHEASPEQKALRMKVVEVIELGLWGVGTASPALPAASCSSPGVLPPALAAAEIEAALFGLYGGPTAEYRHHARMLRRNLVLPGNAPLRSRVLSGDMAAQELVSLDSRSLAPEALQEQRRVAEREAARQLVVQVDELPVLRVDDLRDQTYTPAAATPELPEAEPAGLPLSDAEAAPPATASTTMAASPAEPSPTPFTPSPGLEVAAFTPTEVLATPVQDENEQEAELIRWFSQRVV